MKLTFDLLEFECNVVAPATGASTYEDWIKLSVHVRTPGFVGDFQWEVMIGEIERFLQELEEAYARLGNKVVVTLDPAEPNVKLQFTFNSIGQIEGEYRFRANPGFEPSLTGTFHLDQTYVPGVVAAFRSVLHDAENGG